LLARQAHVHLLADAPGASGAIPRAVRDRNSRSPLVPAGKYEPMLYGWREGTDHFWCGARDQGDVWFVNKPQANVLHPTQKPVELVERAIRNSSKSRDSVLDPFGGSGTTLIACEKHGRQARLVELEPKYVDVVVRRWEQYTELKATLSSPPEAHQAHLLPAETSVLGPVGYPGCSRNWRIHVRHAAPPALRHPRGSGFRVVRRQYAVISSCRSRSFHRTANCVLTVCVSRGGKRKPTPAPARIKPQLR
jgi:hypothetical protein